MRGKRRCCWRGRRRRPGKARRRKNNSASAEQRDRQKARLPNGAVAKRRMRLRRRDTQHRVQRCYRASPRSAATFRDKTRTCLPKGAKRPCAAWQSRRSAAALFGSRAVWQARCLTIPPFGSRAFPLSTAYCPSLLIRAVPMCRNIKTLANFEPPATDDEIRASALQFVRKLSGTTRPSRVNEEVFNQAVADVTAVAQRLIEALEIHAPPRNREEEARKAKERAQRRFA